MQFAMVFLAVKLNFYFENRPDYISPLDDIAFAMYQVQYYVHAVWLLSTSLPFTRFFEFVPFFIICSVKTFKNLVLWSQCFVTLDSRKFWWELNCLKFSKIFWHCSKYAFNTVISCRKYFVSCDGLGSAHRWNNSRAGTKKKRSYKRFSKIEFRIYLMK